MPYAAALSGTVPEEDPFATLSRAELLACARLLAVSIAHHRDKYGTGVPLAASAARLRQLGENSRGQILNAASRAVIDEALAVLAREEDDSGAARTLALAQTPGDQRRQLRVSLIAPMQISDADGRRQRAATLRSISWGGAAIQCQDRGGTLGDRVKLHLPDGTGGRIDVLATITWADGLDDAREFGLRFNSLAPEDDERLQDILERLAPAPEPGAQRLSIVPRLEIEYSDPTELRATLESVSESGFTLAVLEPLRINQSLLVCLTSAHGDIELKLRARVIDQKRIGGARLEMYAVGLEFEYPAPQLRERIEAALHDLDTLLPVAGPR
jgi:hypothetical protein